MDIWQNIQAKWQRLEQNTIGKFTPTPNHTNPKRAVVGQKPTRRQIDARRKVWARRFLLRAWRLWKAESLVVLGAKPINVPESGPLPHSLYGKDAEIRIKTYLADQSRRLKNIERGVKALKYRLQQADQIRVNRELKARNIARTQQISVESEERREFYRQVLESCDGPGGGRRRYESPEKAKEFRKLYMRAYHCVNKTWTGQDKRLSGSSIRPRIGPGVAAFYRNVATSESIICHYCLHDIPPSKRTVDHYIPLARGGSHSRENLVAACSTCNARKSDLMPDEFFAGQKPNRNR